MKGSQFILLVIIPTSNTLASTVAFAMQILENISPLIKFVVQCKGDKNINYKYYSKEMQLDKNYE